MTTGSEPKVGSERAEAKMPIQMQSEIAQLNVELEQTDDPREAYAMVQAKVRR